MILQLGLQGVVEQLSQIKVLPGKLLVLHRASFEGFLALG